MYMCVRGIDLASVSAIIWFYFWNSSDSVVFFSSVTTLNQYVTWYTIITHLLSSPHCFKYFSFNHDICAGQILFNVFKYAYDKILYLHTIVSSIFYLLTLIKNCRERKPADGTTKRNSNPEYYILII